MTTTFRYTLIWLLTGAIAFIAASNMLKAAYVDGAFVPVGNDSFYHARRILDTAEDPGAFYEFDTKIHVPEGSWLTWPWGYDYAMAMLVRGVRSVNPDAEPMKILAYIPALWVFVNLGLLLAIAAALRLPPGWALLGGVATALSPLTQMLHGVGVVDHHFVEFTFVLATLWLGLRYFQNSGQLGKAVALGIILGLAPAFHTALFVLQLPVVAAIGLAWLRGDAFDRRATLLLAASLLVTTALILWPSAAFHDGQFFFYTLSRFHLYAAASSAAFIAYTGWSPVSSRQLVGLAVLLLLVLVPMAAQLSTAAGFLGAKITRLEVIIEAMSLTRLLEHVGTAWVFALYSGLLLTVPLIVLVAVAGLIKRRPADQVFVLLYALFGIGLLLIQFRLHYFGSFAIFLALPLAGYWLCQRFPTYAVPIAGTAVLALGGAYYAPVKSVLFANLDKAWDSNYEYGRFVFHKLRELCEREPGVVLANHNDGHYIRYHTDCSVMSNNFILTPQHEGKLLDVDALMTFSPQDIRREAPIFRYVYARFETQFQPGHSGTRVPLDAAELRMQNAPLVNRLLLDDDTPEGFELEHEARLFDDRNIPFGRLFRIKPLTAGDSESGPPPQEPGAGR